MKSALEMSRVRIPSAILKFITNSVFLTTHNECKKTGNDPSFERKTMYQIHLGLISDRSPEGISSKNDSMNLLKETNRPIRSQKSFMASPRSHQRYEKNLKRLEITKARQEEHLSKKRSLNDHKASSNDGRQTN